MAAYETYETDKDYDTMEMQNAERVREPFKNVLADLFR